MKSFAFSNLYILYQSIDSKILSQGTAVPRQSDMEAEGIHTVQTWNASVINQIAYFHLVSVLFLNITH